MTNPKMNIEPERPDVSIEINVANKGTDGHTPVKGVDYWTDEDRQEIIDEVKTQVDVSGSGTVVSVNGNRPDKNGNVIVPPELPSPEDIPIADGDLLPFDKVLGVGIDLNSDDMLPRWELVKQPAIESVRFTKQTLNVDQQAQARENIGAQPKGDYALRSEIPDAPVQSVNGKIGAVKLTASDVGALPDTTEIPVVPDKVSAFENDAGYLTEHQDLSDYARRTDIPDTSAFITRAVNDLANYYLKSETYTRSEIDTRLSAIPKFSISVVSFLPTENISETTIYLVSGGSDGDLYTEYIHVNGVWEILGSQRVDLTGYATQAWTQEQLAGYQPKGDYALRNELPAVPVQSVNGKTGAVQLAAKDVGARPSTWTPGASEVGADPSGTAASAVKAHDSDNAAHSDIREQLSQLFSQKEDKFDPTAYGLPVLYLTGDISPIRVSKDNKVTLTYVYGERSGTCTLKGQGSSSYKIAQAMGEKGKYNYTITFDTAFEAADGWGEQKKYCLKANKIDCSHSRNVVSAKLWGMIVKSRTNANANLSGLVNGGAVDGFPIVIMVNDEFHGLYTFNIPKDGWMMGLAEDTSKMQAIFGANDHETATQFKGLLAGDESDFEMEFISDENNTAWAIASLNTMIQACIDSWGGDLDDVVGQYLDWDSVIDYYIFIVVVKGSDMVDKNYLLSTFNGTKWHFTAYDMDSTYGLNWDGSGLSRAVSNINFEECAATHRAYELVKRFKTDKLKARYIALRANVLSETRIMQMFENFAWAIPSPVLLEDVKRYPAAVQGSSVNTIDQIGRWVRQRLEAADAWINALPAQETPAKPDIPVAGYTNLVPTSTDTDGSIYNGVGYKENVRLSSSGGVSGTPQNGSVTTGFMPYTYKAPLIVRMKGATWVGESQVDSSTHWYINFYDVNKGFFSGVVSSGLGSYATTMEATYDADTGITTFDFSKADTSSAMIADHIKSGAYIRINAKGKGADLIVTVNEEIK